jgi:hypothetical protein
MSHHALEEATLEPSQAGSVLADIGGDVGAAVVYLPAAFAGLEIEIRADGTEWSGTHTGVRERHVGDKVLWAAFFGSLRAGRYELRRRGDPSRCVEVEVVGGEVTEARW